MFPLIIKVIRGLTKKRSQSMCNETGLPNNGIRGHLVHQITCSYALMYMSHLYLTFRRQKFGRPSPLVQ
jgi:hypothetical protein